MNRLIYAFVALLLLPIFLNSQNLKPYIRGAQWDISMNDAKTKAIALMEENGLEILGKYTPASDNKRCLIAFTSSELKEAVGKIGGKTGFAAALRLAITMEEGKAVVSYTNPEYWGNAYFRNDFTKVQDLYKKLNGRLLKSFSGKESFGSEDGHSVAKLRKYHYMMAMPYFEDDVELGSFSSFDQAVSTIDKNLASNKNTQKVYEISFPDDEIKLYGIGISGENGESKFMPIIDISKEKHTAFLPYELLVYKDKAYMLHGRFRIALSFPDLSMGTFMKIVSTPGEIEDALRAVCQ